ncbi:MAG: hypothetical protein ACO1OK_07260 [Devosia sp.]
MAKSHMQVEFSLKNILLGVGFVLIAMVIVRLLLPQVLPLDAVLTIASVALGVAFWFLFLVSRHRAG